MAQNRRASSSLTAAASVVACITRSTAENWPPLRVSTCAVRHIASAGVDAGRSTATGVSATA